MRSRLAIALLLLLVLSVGVAAWPYATSGSGGVPPGALLPDLEAIVPQDLAVAKGAFGGSSRWLLAFTSATINVGDGPLVIAGSRPWTRQPTMTATQVISLQDGTTADHGPVGVLRYIADATHSHWHLIGFMRYEVRSVAKPSLVRRDKKEGFCLGDRFAIGGNLPAAPAQPVYQFTDCGRKQPQALTLTEGISVGFGDNYEPFRDGQFVDITGLPAGRYVLVHTANPTGAVLEKATDNDSSSLLVQIAWPHGLGKRPTVTPLKQCPLTATCVA